MLEVVDDPQADGALLGGGDRHALAVQEREQEGAGEIGPACAGEVVVVVEQVLDVSLDAKVVPFKPATQIETPEVAHRGEVGFLVVRLAEVLAVHAHVVVPVTARQAVGPDAGEGALPFRIARGPAAGAVARAERITRCDGRLERREAAGKRAVLAIGVVQHERAGEVLSQREAPFQFQSLQFRVAGVELEIQHALHARHRVHHGNALAGLEIGPVQHVEDRREVEVLELLLEADLHVRKLLFLVEQRNARDDRPHLVSCRFVQPAKVRIEDAGQRAFGIRHPTGSTLADIVGKRDPRQETAE